MPNRIVREGILDSDAVNKLTWAGEVFYRRLMSIVDDFGRYDARLEMLRAKLYPMKLDKVSLSDVGKWLTECVEAGLVRCYEVLSKPFLEIVKFEQQVRIKKSKFPAPVSDDVQMITDDFTCCPETNPIQSNPKPNLESNHDSTIFSFEKTKEMFFGERILIEHTCKEKQVNEQVAMFYMQKFWDRQYVLQKITTRSYSDFKTHYVNSLPKMKLPEVENKGEGTYKSKGI